MPVPHERGHRSMKRLPMLRLISIPIVALTAISLAAVKGRPGSPHPVAASTHASCPPGYEPFSREGAATLLGHTVRDKLCINQKHPETMADMAALGAQQYAVQAAPGTTIPR